MPQRPRGSFFLPVALGFCAGLATIAADRALAEMSGPAEHAGLTVDMLAELPADTLRATVGLEGHTMRMRAIEIAPGGHIAEHGHADRPGIVTVIDGAWVEGRPSGERTFQAAALGTFPEKEDTVHWVHNRTDAPAIALVCDIARAE